MKNIGILGTGVVGNTIGKKLIELGYNVKMGSRTKGNEKALNWVNANGPNASEGPFAEAAQFGELLFLCVKGSAISDVLNMSGPENFNSKTVIDLTNSLDFSKGFPPSLLVSNTNSLGEEVQKALPNAHVVKTLNIVNCEVMVNPGKAGGDGTMFVSGNDSHAKEGVAKLLREFGWNDIIDLGDISTARGTEMLLPLWVRTMAVLKTPHFAFKVVK